MLYSLTDKLKFSEPPQIEIKGKKLTIDNSASNVLKIMDIVQTKGDFAGTMAVFELLFSAKDQKTIENFKLTIEDYTKLAEVAIALALGNDPDNTEPGEE